MMTSINADVESKMAPAASYRLFMLSRHLYSEYVDSACRVVLYNWDETHFHLTNVLYLI